MKKVLAMGMTAAVVFVALAAWAHGPYGGVFHDKTTCGTTATPLKSFGAKVFTVKVSPSAGATVYFGAADVTASGAREGYPIAPGQSLNEIPLRQVQDLHCVVAAGTETVHILGVN